MNDSNAAGEVQEAYRRFSRSFHDLIAAVESAESRAKHGQISPDEAKAIYAELLALEGFSKHWPTKAKEHLERWEDGPPEAIYVRKT